jgi:hypothetical protein
MLDADCQGDLNKDVENLDETIVEIDEPIRLSRAAHLEKGLKPMVAFPRIQDVSALSGIALRAPSLADDWLNPEGKEAWVYLQ